MINKNNAFISTAKALVLSVCLVVLSFCSKPKPAEEQLLLNLEQAKLAVEQLNADELEDILAPDFKIRGPKQNFDLEKIRKTMFLFSLRKQKITIILSNSSVTLDEHSTHLAAINSTAIITGTRGLIPEDGRIYQVKSQWRLYDDEWKLSHLNWE